MARSRSRLGLLATLATAVRSALRPGSPGLRERAYAVPRLVRAALRGDYREVTTGHLALLAAAVLYILSPIDLVPEGLLNVIGLADDAVVLGWLVAALVNDTEGFLQWEGARDRTQNGGQNGGQNGDQNRQRGGDRARTSGGPQDAPASARGATVPGHVVG